MNQETLVNPGKPFTASFQQKSAGLSLMITIAATIYYFTTMWPMRPIALTSDSLPSGYGSLVLTTIALIIVAQIVLQTVLAAINHSAPGVTAHQQAAIHKAGRNAHLVLTLGIFIVVGSVFLEELTPFCTANLAILSFALAEIVKFASQLFYIQR